MLRLWILFLLSLLYTLLSVQLGFWPAITLTIAFFVISVMVRSFYHHEVTISARTKHRKVIF